MDSLNMIHLTRDSPALKIRIGISYRKPDTGFLIQLSLRLSQVSMEEIINCQTNIKKAGHVSLELP